jgi:hypothetical protein
MFLRASGLGARIAPWHPCVTTELDVVCMISANRVEPTLRCHSLEHYSGYDFPKRAPTHTARQHFLDLMCGAQKIVPRDDVVPAVKETGLIVFAPQFTRDGYLIS